jgi:hypothetical protein
MSAFTRTARREVLARTISDMRPSIDNVHSAMLAVSEFGITYAAVAGATRTNEVRAQRWSAGADIPESVGERRAILSALARLLGEMPTTPDRRRKADVVPLNVKQEYMGRQCIVCLRRQVRDDVREICGATQCFRVWRKREVA